MNNIIIREIDNNDIKKISEIEAICFKHPWSEEDFIFEVNNNPFAKILVILVDNEIVGYLDYLVTFNSSSISKIAINPKYQKLGLASKLMDKMFLDIAALGYGEVETITLEVRVSNIAAINLYYKFGFKDVVIKKGYYADGEDARYMMKVLL